LCDKAIFTPQIFAGLRDTLRIVQEFAGEHPGLERLEAELAAAPTGLASAFTALGRATDAAKSFAAALPADADTGLVTWSQALVVDCEDHRTDLVFLAPWVKQAPAATESGASEQPAPTLRAVPARAARRGRHGFRRRALL
jgi:hypothetical protein